MIINQAYLFLIFIVVGAIIGLIFDFFRILRKSFKTNDIFIYIQDVIFWILTGLIILIAIFYFSNGEIRLFMFVGMIIGIIFYLILLSKYITKFSIKIINCIKKLIIKLYNFILIPVKFIYNFFNFIIYKPFKCIIINLITKINKIKLFSTKIKLNNIKNAKNK